MSPIFALWGRILRTRADVYVQMLLTVVGAALLVGLVGLMAVAAHGQGYGPRLLHYADEQARAHGLFKCSLMVSPTNKVAMRLYKKHGYEIVSTHQHKNPVASYHRMVKELR